MVITHQPRKLSEWFQQAIADVQACATDPNYRLDMGSWHLGTLIEFGQKKREPHCLVCLAGSLLAKTFCARPEETWDASGDGGRAGVPADTAWLMRAINSLRLGDLVNAVRSASLSNLCVGHEQLQDLRDYGDALSCEVECNDPNTWQCAPYQLDMQPFLTSMRKVLDTLVSLGV